MFSLSWPGRWRDSAQSLWGSWGGGLWAGVTVTTGAGCKPEWWEPPRGARQPSHVPSELQGQASQERRRSCFHPSNLALEATQHDFHRRPSRAQEEEQAPYGKRSVATGRKGLRIPSAVRLQPEPMPVPHRLPAPNVII